MQMNESMNDIRIFLESDTEKVRELINEYPGQLSVPIIARFLGTTTDSVRAAVEAGVFGMAWRKPGVNNRGFLIPTAQFVRWYLAERGVRYL